MSLHVQEKVSNEGMKRSTIQAQNRDEHDNK